MIERPDEKRKMEFVMKKTSMKLTIIISITVLALGLFAPLKAADAMTILTWNISFPFEQTKEFAQKSESLRGVAFEYRTFVQPHISVGIYGGWHVFDGNTTETIHVETEGDEAVRADITGKQFRYINSFPIMFDINVYLGNPRGFQAYVGVGAGTMAIEERVDLGNFVSELTRWHLAVAPEIGFKFPLGHTFSGIASAKYHYAFPAKRITGEKYAHSYVSLNLGFAWDHNFFF